MKIFIHIGTHKTGSTLIQNVCRKNHEALKSQGVYYPIDGYTQSGHHELAWALMRKNTAVAKKYVDDALKKASGCESIIFSSEEFEFLRDFKVAENLFPSNASINVICYFRRQDKYLESEYNQHVKMVSTRLSTDIFKFFMYHDFYRRFNYMSIISGWDKSGLVDVFSILSYDREAKRNNLLGSFFECIGFDFSKYGIDLKSQVDNKSIPPSALIYLARYNDEGGGDSLRGKFVDLVLEEVFDKNKKEGGGERFLSKEYASRLVKRFEGSNKRLANNFSDGKDFFEMDFDDNSRIVDFYLDYDHDVYARVVGKLGSLKDGGGQ
jgi:hypothetical protein